MKTLLVTMLLCIFAQSAQAANIELSEGQSKKLYNILATFGLRHDFPADRQTHEWLKPVKCLKSVEDGLYYICEGVDKMTGEVVSRTGTPARKLYDLLVQYNGKVCNIEGRCNTASPNIYCIYYWPNKDNPPPRHYRCTVEQPLALF